MRVFVCVCVRLTVCRRETVGLELQHCFLPAPLPLSSCPDILAERPLPSAKPMDAHNQKIHTFKYKKMMDSSRSAPAAPSTVRHDDMQTADSPSGASQRRYRRRGRTVCLVLQCQQGGRVDGQKVASAYQPPDLQHSK